jgi:hypothetical protein
MGVLIVLVLVVVLAGVPSYVIGQRRGVSDAWVAFIPFVGPTIVLLWSIGRSGWMVLLGVIPLVNLVFGIWLLFSVPSNHGRSLLWGLLVPLIGMYTYAFTLDTSEPHQASWVA